MASSLTGETLWQHSLNSDPSPPLCLHRSTDMKQMQLAVALNAKSLLFCNLDTADREVSQQFELSFKNKYGSILAFDWLADDEVIVAFSGGSVVAVSLSTYFILSTPTN